METVGQDSIEGGYKKLTAGQLANISLLIGKGEISMDAARVVLAAANMVAAREAAARTRAQAGDDRPVGCLYTPREIAERTGLSLGRVERALEELESVGLMVFSSSHIEIASDPLPQVAEEAEELVGSPGPNRPVPLPRRIIRGLRKLCRKRDKNAFVIAIACLLRAMWIKKRERVIRYDGYILNRTLMGVFGLCERAVQNAKRKLKKIGLLLDWGRISRHGWGFKINLWWNRAEKEAEEGTAEALAQPAGQVTAVASVGAPEAPKGDERGQEQRESEGLKAPEGAERAPQGAEKGAERAPLNNQKTLNRNHNQQLVEPSKTTPESRNLTSGVVFSKETEKPKTPTRGLWNVQVEELLSAKAIESCYQRGIAVGVIKPSDMNRLSVFSAAASVVRRVDGTIGDRAKIFASIVRKAAQSGLWLNISDGDEDKARGLIKGLEQELDQKTVGEPVKPRAQATGPVRAAISPKEAQAAYERNKRRQDEAIKAREEQIAAKERAAVDMEQERQARRKERNKAGEKAEREAFLASLPEEMRLKVLAAEQKRQAKAAQIAGEGARRPSAKEVAKSCLNRCRAILTGQEPVAAGNQG